MEQAVGKISWVDLTVPDAAAVRDFYQAVVGWTSSGIDMGGYEDFCMIPPQQADAAAGICYARGGNSDMPPVWLIYITVEDLARSIQECERHGGTVVRPPKKAGPGQFCIIRDPAGALCGLYQLAE